MGDAGEVVLGECEADEVVSLARRRLRTSGEARSAETGGEVACMGASTGMGSRRRDSNAMCRFRPGKVA